MQSFLWRLIISYLSESTAAHHGLAARCNAELLSYFHKTFMLCLHKRRHGGEVLNTCDSSRKQFLKYKFHMSEFNWKCILLSLSVFHPPHTDQRQLNVEDWDIIGMETDCLSTTCWEKANTDCNPWALCLLIHFYFYLLNLLWLLQIWEANTRLPYNDIIRTEFKTRAKEWKTDTSCIQAQPPHNKHSARS